MPENREPQLNNDESLPAEIELENQHAVEMPEDSVDSKEITNREKYLTVEQLAKIRRDITTPKLRAMELTAKEYLEGDKKVVIFKRIILARDAKGEEIRSKLKDISKKKKEGEDFSFETEIVNILLEQQRIAESFELERKQVFSSLKLDYTSGGEKILMGSYGELFILSLDKHISILKEHGATQEQIITELSGHVFHEAIHKAGDDGLDGTLLGGKPSLGEVTSITGQLAYYLEKGYTGPKSYESRDVLKGVLEIKDGKGSERDYDIATCVAAELLLEQLQATYPEISAEATGLTSLDKCENMVSKIPEEEETN